MIQNKYDYILKNYAVLYPSKPMLAHFYVGRKKTPPVYKIFYIKSK